MGAIPNRTFRTLRVRLWHDRPSLRQAQDERSCDSRSERSRDLQDEQLYDSSVNLGKGQYLALSLEGVANLLTVAVEGREDVVTEGFHLAGGELIGCAGHQIEVGEALFFG